MFRWFFYLYVKILSGKKFTNFDLIFKYIYDKYRKLLLGKETKFFRKEAFIMKIDEEVYILLVDDRPENLLALEAILERNDYHLVKASSGEEALKYLLKYNFAVIILDVQMPGIDGYGTAKIIKAREKTKNIPIIFITANNMDSEHIFYGYSSGAIDYLLKPFNPLILKAKVEGFVELYKLNQKLIHQADILLHKTRELERANNELTNKGIELRISEAITNVISETSIDSMITIDKDGFILKVNPTVHSMFLFHPFDIIGQHISIIFSEEISQRYIRGVLEAAHSLEQIIGYENHKEIIATRKDGTTFPAEIQIGKKFVEDQCIIACTIRDITKQKQYQEMVSHMAYHDGLTNLPNRRYFNDYLSSKLSDSKQHHQTLSMLFLDMDRFKYINDSLGHLIGDRLLIEISQRLVANVKEGGFIARIGGDEFNVILPDSNREDALDCAEKIIEAFREPFHIDNYEIYITTGIGISVFPFDGDEPQMLIKNANAALYRAKELGKNKYRVFHNGMNIQSYRSFMLQNDLRKVIERQELSIVYQPRIDTHTETIQSVQAILRWNHPDWGTIYPSEFIPLAEESGLIVEIGEWLLRSVCKQKKTWIEMGKVPLKISVKFSAIQFLQKNLLDMIESILIETNVIPNMLEIEISENVIMGNEELITKTINRIRTMGIHVSIDGFGIGYSSLNYIRKYPVDRLMIDRSFVQDLDKETANSAPIVSTIISLAHSLEMSVIADGVDTEEQLSILKSLNCNEIQGRLFCALLTAKEIEDFLSNPSLKQFTLNGDQGQFLDHSTSLENVDKYSKVQLQEPNTSQNEEVLKAALLRTKEAYSISAREMDVFQLIVDGYSNKEISEKLFISEHTVKNHITRILQKLNVNDRMQAMAKLYQACIEEGNFHSA